MFDCPEALAERQPEEWLAQCPSSCPDDQLSASELELPQELVKGCAIFSGQKDFIFNAVNNPRRKTTTTRAVK